MCYKSKCEETKPQKEICLHNTKYRYTKDKDMKKIKQKVKKLSPLIEPEGSRSCSQ
jgi:hypothetical protein